MNPGIMPRCLDALFNSVADYQTKKFVFKPDKLNGFDVQSEADAMLDRQNEIHAGLYSQKNSKFVRQGSNEKLVDVEKSEERIQVDQDCLYAVFVTYVEIYNNCVYDLLEEEDDGRGSRPLQSKIVREDGNKNMYVHGVTELETKSTSEALEIFHRGQRRRRVAHTSLNIQSSRSHSVFTIRVVQSPLDQHGESIILDKRLITIAQLSLVDLAGSERINRTKNTGQRLREAGNINNSLMTLRSCLEILRENQLTGGTKMVPYRDSKLTHLFKNYFDGDGQVRMIVCVNPSAEDYDETLHVVKFAEMTQEVQTMKSTMQKVDLGFAVGRGKVLKEKEMRDGEWNWNGRMQGKVKQPSTENSTHQDFNSKNPHQSASSSSSSSNFLYTFPSTFPDFDLTEINPRNDEIFPKLIHFLEQRIDTRNQLKSDLTKKQENLRKILSNLEKERLDLKIENSTLKASNSQQKKKLEALEGHLGKTEEQRENLRIKLEKANETIKSLRCELKESELTLNQRLIDKQRARQRFNSKMQAEADKMNKELEMKLRQQREMLKGQMKEKEDKLRLVKKILEEEKAEEGQESAEGKNDDDGGVKRRRMVAGNKRYRRSQSADRWVDHRPGAIVPVGTVLQPLMRRRRSVTRLNSPKEITQGASRYCLVAQEIDTDGELETKLFKGDIIPTSGGGAQVIFNDMERLKQSSPSARKRSGDGDGQGLVEKRRKGE